jgi:hypothetical protein
MIYKNSNSSLLTLIITEEFLPDKEYFIYFYHPAQILIRLFYAFLIVFSSSITYLPSIILGICYIVLCNLYAVSYIVSYNPYKHLYDLIFVSVVILIEILFLFIPLVYSQNVIQEWILDSLTVFFFALGCTCITFKGLLGLGDGNIMIEIEEHIDKVAELEKNNSFCMDILKTSQINNDQNLYNTIKIIKTKDDLSTSHTPSAKNKSYNKSILTHRDNKSSNEDLSVPSLRQKNHSISNFSYKIKESGSPPISERSHYNPNVIVNNFMPLPKRNNINEKKSDIPSLTQSNEYKILKPNSSIASETDFEDKGLIRVASPPHTSS